VLFETADELGIWVRNDAVFLPKHVLEAARIDGSEPRFVCSSTTCVRALSTLPCIPPECPVYGDLVLGERPLHSTVRVPESSIEWQQRSRDLRRDPALSGLIDGAGAEAYVERKPTPIRVGWASNRFKLRSPELSLSAAAGDVLGSEGRFAGASLRLALRKASAVSDSTTGGYFSEIAVGDGWGFDTRYTLLREFNGAGSLRTFVAAGAAIAAENAIGRSTSTSRLRVPSILGFVLPEVGVASFLGEPVHLYTSHGLPLYLLLTPGFALEARPALSLIYGAAHDGDPEALLSLSLGLMGRLPYESCP
jgi:hypothetical protein